MRSTVAVALALAAGAHAVAVESESKSHVFGKGGAGVYRPPPPPSATGNAPPRLGKDGAGVLNAINQGCRNSIVGNLLGGERDRSHAQLTCARWAASSL